MNTIERMTKIVEVAMKLKNIMIGKNKTQAWTNCPFCNVGKLYGSLVENKRLKSGKAIRMQCNECDVILME